MGPGVPWLRRMHGLSRANGIEAPEGGVALPLRYTVYERSTYSVVPSNAIWRDPAHADLAAILRGSGELAQRRPQLYFPHVMRDARRIGGVLLRASPPTAPNAWTGSASRWRT